MRRRSEGPAAGSGAALIVAVLLVLEAAFVLALATRTLQFGAEALHGQYFYSRTLTSSPIIRALLVMPPALVLVFVATRTIERWEVPTVVVTTVVGFLLQFPLIDVDSIPSVVDSTVNPYYQLARHTDFSHILRDYLRLAKSYPVGSHLRSNMPGKSLLYSILTYISTDPRVLGYLVIALSSAGAVLAYLVCRRVFANRRTALFALVLYLFLPSRLFFEPWLNTVTPVLILAVVWTFLCWLDGRRRVLLVLLGILLYLTVLFEPTPLLMVLALVPLTVRAARSGRFSATALLQTAANLCLVTFLVVHLLFWRLFDFDVFAAFLHVWNDAHQLNAQVHRPYAGWLLPNLRELIINSGIGISFLALLRIAFVGTSGDGRRHAGRRTALDAGDMFTIGVVPTVVLLDLLGVNRGEVTRLWIFVGVFLCFLAADLLARLPTWVFAVVLACTILQAALEGWTISFISFPYATLASRNSPIVDVTLVAVLVGVVTYGIVASRRRGQRADSPLLT